MPTLCGILGKKDEAAVAAMAAAMKHRGTASHTRSGRSYSVACSQPLGKRPCLLDGNPLGKDGAPLSATTMAELLAGSTPSTSVLQGAYACVSPGKTLEQWRLTRDRLGQRPLYYYDGGGFLLFASELKGLLASGLVPKLLNLRAVDHFLTFRCVPGPESIIQGVQRVPPGSVLAYANGAITEHRGAPISLNEQPTTREKAVLELSGLLGQAVNRCSAEDLLWSSGIDCAALAAKNPGLSPVNVALPHAWQRDTKLARESARALRLPLIEAKARPLTETAFRDAVYHLDEPVADAAVFPLYLILEQAAKEATEFATGHGADELLGGYPRYHFLEKTRGVRGFVPVNFLASLEPAIPPNAFMRRGSRFLTRIHDDAEASLSLLAVFDARERDVLYTEAMRSALHDQDTSPTRFHQAFGSGDLTRDMLAADLTIGLPDLLLTECDRLAAAHGVTLHFPYLDDALVDFASALPPEVKFGVRAKPLLRLAMRNVLPGRIRMRARRGFHVPQEGNVMRVIQQIAEQTITPDRVEDTGLFRWHEVSRIVRGAQDNIYRRRQFWALLMFFAWHREIMERA